MLKPVVKVLKFNTTAAISGAATPTGVPTSVYAIVLNNTLSTADVAENGTFKVTLLPAGVYSLAIHPAAGYPDTTHTGIGVTAGNTTNVGTCAADRPVVRVQTQRPVGIPHGLFLFRGGRSGRASSRPEEGDFGDR